MHHNEAANILKSLVEGRDPSSGKELSADSVLQRANVIRALLVGHTAIETVLAREKRRAQLPERVGDTWSPEEDDRLRTAFQAGESIEALASSHERTPNAIQARLERLNLVPPDPNAKLFRFPVPENTDDRPRKRRGRPAKRSDERHSESHGAATQED
jgi:hypothetical protein